MVLISFPITPIFPGVILVFTYSSIYSVGSLYEGWNFNSGNYLFTSDTK